MERGFNASLLISATHAPEAARIVGRRVVTRQRNLVLDCDICHGLAETIR